MTERILYTTCPLCEYSEIVPFAHADWSSHVLYSSKLDPIIHWLLCLRCEHVFTNGYWTQTSLDTLFAKTLSWQTPTQISAELGNARTVWAPLLNIIHGFESQKWLDVGCGAGHLLALGQEAGYHMTGLDLRKETCKLLTAAGHNVYALALTDFQSPPFDIISMCDVLEHTAFPKAELQAAHGLLNPGGQLFLSMPNRDVDFWRAWDAEGTNPYWSEAEHYHNFTRKRCYSLLREAGFEPKSYHVSNRYQCCMDVLAVKSHPK